MGGNDTYMYSYSACYTLHVRGRHLYLPGSARAAATAAAAASLSLLLFVFSLLLCILAVNLLAELYMAKDDFSSSLQVSMTVIAVQV